MSFNRPQLSGFSGQAQLYRQVAIKSGAYTAAAGDDLIITSAATLSLNATPEPGDMVTVIATGADCVVSGNGANINGAASVTCHANGMLCVAFDGVKWTGGFAAAAA